MEVCVRDCSHQDYKAISTKAFTFVVRVDNSRYVHYFTAGFDSRDKDGESFLTCLSSLSSVSLHILPVSTPLLGRCLEEQGSPSKAVISMLAAPCL